MHNRGSIYKIRAELFILSRVLFVPREDGRCNHWSLISLFNGTNVGNVRVSSATRLSEVQYQRLIRTLDCEKIADSLAEYIRIEKGKRLVRKRD